MTHRAKRRMKMMNDNTKLTQGTIFDEKDYDEMQKTENHEIGFRLFSTMFFVTDIFAVVLVVVCASAEDTAGTVISLLLTAVSYCFYNIYAYMTAKRGIMNPKFAKTWSSKWVKPVYVMLIVFWCIKMVSTIPDECDFSDIAVFFIWMLTLITGILMSLCADLNNKVLKKQLDDSE